MSSISSLFRRPLLIYDDKCYSCTRFAQLANILSRRWIRIAGHYHSEEAKEAKSVVFPSTYDSSKMFWLINSHGAYGARSGLPQVLKEIAVGISAGKEQAANSPSAISCEYGGERMSCYTYANVIRRIVRLLSHGATFRF
jgi:hypothetical protein